ncbi:MAG: OmpA/MotB domain protein [Chitinophagaceae bacterium]|nr:OmpA/MotB domain protein [Chitinophagaceae bacterium]
MASKKYMLILGFLSLFGRASFGQTTTTTTTTTTNWGDTRTYWDDSARIAAADMAQYSAFRSNQYPYPAKPRSQWEFGLSAGPSFVLGDVHARWGLGGGITLRHAISHVFSYRLGYFGSLNHGEPNAYGVAQIPAQREYHNKTHMGAIDFIASLNTASHYRGNPKTNIYVLAGLDLLMTQVMYKYPGAPSNSGQYIWYGYYGNGQLVPQSQSGTITTLFGTEHNGRKGWTVLGAVSPGAGVAFKVSDKVNLGIEQRFTVPVPGYDQLDAYKAGKSNDIYSYTSARLNINIGNPATHVQPLWWINPYNYIYDELNNPRHMRLPNPILPDADGDGVTDQFDLEPNTPRGCPVDTHGVSRDTDGDGVPDCRDKELLTPQKCFPVNADGVGNCPEPACCAELRQLMQNRPAVDNACNIGSLPSIQFRSGSATLSNDAKSMLNSAASQIKSNPNCRIKVVGYGAADKRAQQLSYDRVNSVIRYLVEQQGISENRLIFNYGQDGDSNTVDLQGTLEEGPSTVPAPHPNMTTTTERTTTGGTRDTKTKVKVKDGKSKTKTKTTP